MIIMKPAAGLHLIRKAWIIEGYHDFYLAKENAVREMNLTLQMKVLQHQSAL